MSGPMDRDLYQALKAVNLGQFKWLEGQDVVSPENPVEENRLIAHAIAALPRRPTPQLRGLEIEKRMAFANYLVLGGYPIDTEDPDTRLTPADVAFKTGNIPVGLVYLRAGAFPRAQHLDFALEALSNGATVVSEVRLLIVELARYNCLDKEAAFTKISDLANGKNARVLAPILETLIGEGLALTKENQNRAQVIFEQGRDLRGSDSTEYLSTLVRTQTTWLSSKRFASPAA